MNTYTISELDLLGEDERGASYEFKTRPTSGFLMATRKKGSKSGNHWHQGKSATKNPEILLLVYGEILLETKNITTGEEDSMVVKGPKKIEIYPNILHTLTSQTDCCFLEFNSLEEHKVDTTYPS